MATPRTKRDVTRALTIARQLRGENATDPRLGELVSILEQIDARTGRRDPRVRKGKKPAVRKAAKRSARGR